MERGLSFDDLMDGIHKLSAAGFPRNDSESLFQDYLRRIPSSGTLTAADSFSYLDPAQQAQLQHSVQQIQQQAAQQAAQQETLCSASSGLQEVGSLEVKGFPRVASLDYLQQLVQQSTAPPTLKQAPATSGAFARCCEAPHAIVELGLTSTSRTESTSDDRLQPGPLSDLPVSAQPQVPLLPAQPMHTSSLPQSSPQQLMAAAMQLGNLGSGLGQRSPVEEMPEKDSKAEVRRARRYSCCCVCSSRSPCSSWEGQS